MSSILHDAYLELTKASSIKVGDTVEILRSFKAGEMGTKCRTDDPDKFDFVGEQAKVTKISNEGGIQVRCSDGKKRHYPFFVLGIADLSEKTVKMTVAEVEALLKENDEIDDDAKLHIVKDSGDC